MHTDLPLLRLFGRLGNFARRARSGAQLPPWTHSRIRKAIEAAASSRPVKDGGVQLPDPEFSHRLRRAIVRAAMLKLDQPPRLSILDIGCGGGFFIAVAKFLGHSCTGTELHPEALSAHVRESYQRYLTALGCTADHEVLVVKPFEPLNLRRQYDLITAGLVCFDELPSGAWSRREWEFFFDDIYRYLTPGGRVYIELNAHREHGGLRWYTPETLAFFKSIGQVRGNVVIVARGDRPDTVTERSAAVSA